MCYISLFCVLTRFLDTRLALFILCVLQYLSSFFLRIFFLFLFFLPFLYLLSVLYIHISCIVFREGLPSLKHKINSTLVCFLFLSRSLGSIVLPLSSPPRVFRPPPSPRTWTHARTDARPHARVHAYVHARRLAKFSKRHSVSHGHKSSFLALSSHLERCQHACARFVAVSSATSVRPVLTSL